MRIRRRSVQCSRLAVTVSLVSCVLLCAASLGLGAESAQGNGEPKNKKVLLIGHAPDHPPGTHLYLPECEILAKCLRQTAGVEAVVSDGWPKDPKVLDGVDAIVLYSSPGADILLGGEHAKTVERLLKQGVGLVALHWGTACHGREETEVGKRYLEHMGGLFCFAYSGINISKSRVEQLDGDHSICRGWDDFALTDEYYLNLKFLPEAKPILNVPVQGKNQTVAWVYERPDSNGGRSYGNTLGHFHVLFCQEPFRRMLVNGILWTAHCRIPPGGAPCVLSEEDLKLE